MTLPRISIVTPAYNAQEFIEETILSVLDQNYPNLQYIIIDGGSLDKTPEIISKYEKHLHFWISESDSGQSDAIIKGLHLCHGDVFNWLNSDDTYSAGALRVVGEFFSDPKTQVLAGRSRKFGIDLDYLSSGTDIYDTIERTVGKARIDQPETFFRLERVLALGGPSPNLHYIMDREFWIRYLICFGLEGVIKTDNVFVNFRHHKSSKTISEASGFIEEDFLLSRWFLQLSQHDIELLTNALAPIPFMLSKAKAEWCLHHYQMAYALRDWTGMDFWDTQAHLYGFSPSVQLCRLHLRLRRFLLSIPKLIHA
jgi:glycosyltransferase involved in cell wall biosynthesis